MLTAKELKASIMQKQAHNSKAAALPPVRVESVVRPCPFCGAGSMSWEIADEYGRKGYRIGCLHPECDMRPYTITNWATMEDAIAAWNRRPNTPGEGRGT